MASTLHIIVAEGLTSERREVCHELIKEHAEEWWHQMPDVWIAGGLSAATWRDHLTPDIRGTGASVMVFRLPPDRTGWAYFGIKADERLAWLHERYVPTAT